LYQEHVFETLYNLLKSLVQVTQKTYLVAIAILA